MDETERLKKVEELKRQRDELDRLINELSQPQILNNTNIPYTFKFLSEFSSVNPVLDLQAYKTQEILEMKLFVNKKCNQISTDYNHTMSLIQEILPLKNNKLFMHVFVHKLLDQGRVQVSSHLESYKPLSYILVKLESEEIIKIYGRLMISKGGTEMELRGIYAIYFGCINLKENLDMCWIWISSVLNCQCNEKTGYVLEVFLLICGGMLYEKLGPKFLKLLKYIKTYFLKELSNPAVEVRISEVIAKYLNQ